MAKPLEKPPSQVPQKPKKPVHLPKAEIPGDGFPADKDVSTPPPGSDQGAATTLTQRHRKQE